MSLTGVDSHRHIANDNHYHKVMTRDGMDYQFLCDQHKQKLLDHLDATVPIGASWMRQGRARLDVGDLEGAIQYFGCAYDLAKLQVERFTGHAEQDGKRHIDRLLDAGRWLGEGLVRCGHVALKREFVRQINTIVAREQSRTPLLAHRLPEPEDSGFELAHQADALSSKRGMRVYPH